MMLVHLKLNTFVGVLLLTYCKECSGLKPIDISQKATLKASPKLTYSNFDYKKENAVDGIVGTDANKCGCCYASAKDRAPYFQATLVEPIYILSVVLEGRKDTNKNDDRLSHIHVLLDGNSAPVNYTLTSNTAVVRSSLPVQTIRVERPYTSSGKGWYLVICELKVFSGENLLPNINESITTNMSRVWSGFNSSLALDGRIDTDVNNFESCKCCSVTDNNIQPWWDIELGKQYLIQAIFLIGRQRGSPEQSQGLSLYIKNQTDSTNGSLLVYNLGTNISYLYIFNRPRIFQLLTVRRWTGGVLTICEMAMIEGECSIGTFGDYCNRNCHCKDGHQCDTTTGKCKTPGCQPGWKDESCETACQNGHFGENCTHVCHCYNSADCNDVTGECDNQLCAPGWRGDSCSEACDFGLFGLNCSSICHCRDNSACNNVNGSCENGLCEDGWRGNSCSQECESPKFGTNCSVTCHCLNDTNCNNVNGSCIIGQCEPGWTTHSCSSACQNGHFGENCTHVCHCYNSADCNDVTGECDNQLCAPGWRGDSCSEACDFGLFGLNCSSICHCRDNSACNNVNGSCENGLCEDGWRGNSCSQECESPNFGTNCSVTCHCLNDTNCNNVNGSCIIGQCEPGWTTHSCSSVCTLETFGLNCSSICHCRDNHPCNHVNGTCENGLCDDGWQGSSCSQACEKQTFGTNCSKTCHCLNKSDCNNVNGSCFVGLCETGWKTDSCSSVCDNDTFGLNCSSTCHCWDNYPCNHVNGTCENGLCDDGWQGSSCSQACKSQTFGTNCSKTCHCLNNTDCYNVNGSCLIGQCETGWKTDSCSSECDHRTFGIQCSSTCHCLENSSCRPVDGVCTTDLCDSGFQGRSCNEECNERKFGLNCSQSCNCFNKTSCDNILGTCKVGHCDPGYQGNTCSEPLTERQSDGSSGGAAVGAGIGTAIAVLAVVAVVVVLYLKRRKSKNGNAEARSGPANIFSQSLNQERVDLDDKEDTQVEVNVNIGFIDDDNTYYNMNAASSGIRLDQLWSYIRRCKEDGSKLFYEEFKSLPYGLVHPYEDSQKPENRKKNRYRDMYAYDHSRVILDVSRPGETDYINACHISGYDTEEKFIASQGPTDVMIDDFWRMIWQQKVEKIIMLTNPTEAGAVKCVQYWPEHGEEVYGTLQVRLIETDESVDYFTRKLVIKMLDGPEREVTQFHFKSWPDKDVPDSTFSLVSFWRAASQSDSKYPILVHCSAGIGRTGTYIALDILYNQMKAERGITPLNVVQNLRKQRVNMVQTKDQYVYLHEAVADALCMGTHFVWSSQFQAVCDYMSEREDGSNQTRFADQFDMIVASSKNSSILASNIDVDNEQSSSMMLESNAYRPSVRHSGSKHLQEIGAMYMPNYCGKSVFLVAKSPTDKSLMNFWSLVQEENVKTIISLCDTSAQNYQVCLDMGGDNCILNGGFVANIVDERTHASFTERTFTLTGTEKAEENQTAVKVFNYAGWESGQNIPGEVSTLLDLLEAVRLWQPHPSESSPVLIHCLNGTKKGGLVCVVLSELQRMNREGGQINVLDSLMQMKTRNKGIIQNAEQLRFCYDAILAFIRSQQNQNIYVNV